MMPSTDVSRFHTLFADTQWATAATKSPRADGEAVPPCCYRVLAAASVGLLATANFRESPKSEVRRIPLPRTSVNKGSNRKGAGLRCPAPANSKRHQVGLLKLQEPKARTRCYSAYPPRTVCLTERTPCPIGSLAGEMLGADGCSQRLAMPVERLPIVIASGLIGDPGVEIRMARVRVIVLMILAVIPVVPLVRVAIRGLPPVVDMDVVPLLAVERLLLVFRVVRVAPLSVRGFLVAVVLGAIRFAVLEVRSGVVVLGVLIALTRTRLPGQDRRSHEHHRRQQPQKQHQLSQLILLPKTSSYHFLTVS